MFVELPIPEHVCYRNLPETGRVLAVGAEAGHQAKRGRRNEMRSNCSGDKYAFANTASC